MQSVLFKLCLVSSPPLPCCRCHFAILFCRSVVTFRCTVAVLPFGSYCCRCAQLCMRTELLETSFHIHRDEVTQTLIGCTTTAERQNRIQSYWQRYVSYARTAAAMAMAQWNFSHMQHNSYGVYGILTEFSQRQRRNGSGSMAMEGWKPGVISRHTFYELLHVTHGNLGNCKSRF